MSKPATGTRAHRRTPLAAAGAALLGLSLLLTAAPAIGAANHGSGSTTSGNGSNGGGGGSGNVKVHDAATGLQTGGTDNEPQVCDFWLEFDFAESHEAGAWSVVSIAPTGDGSTVASGTYDTAGDATDASSVIVVPSGHYRVEWAATGATTTKKKTFWVDGGCREPAPPADEPPAEDPAPPSDDPTSPADESPAEDPAPPSDDPAPSPAESPAEDPASASEDPPAEDPAPPSDEPAPPQDEQLPPSGDETAGEDPAPPIDETAVDDLAPPSDESPAEGQDPGSTEPGSSPDQDQLGTTVDASEPTMPDTAMPTRPMPAGFLGTIGLLLLVLVSATKPRRLHPDRE